MASVFFAAVAAPPTLYDQPFHQSPVRADPDDLLTLAGYGFAADNIVVYKAIGNTTLPLSPPSSVPNKNTAAQGTATVVSTCTIPNSLVVKLPSIVVAGASYAVWVYSPSSPQGSRWSNGVRINDARPLWISPDTVYRTQDVASLGRHLKVVGRNLQPAPSRNTQVRLIGPTTYTVSTIPNASAEMNHYVAEVALPATMLAGTYTVQVCRDGLSWVPLSGQQLQVVADLATPTTFEVSSYGCSPTDGLDDTACVLSAIGAATPLGGVVHFGAGEWDLGNPNAPGVESSWHGIIVPVGVSLAGNGSSTTKVLRKSSWTTNVLFTLQGQNKVSQIDFDDEYAFTDPAAEEPRRICFQLGKFPWSSDPGPSPIADVTFIDNLFERMYQAIGDGGFPIRHLYVRNNTFGAYFVGVFPGGNSSLTNVKFHIDDSIISGNTFKPGGFLKPCLWIPQSQTWMDYQQGTMASAIGASRRLDFSGNVADGLATEYLSPGSLPGWRAAFFWHMTGNHEMMLVAQNSATCTGDKAGDGEFIAYDLNQNTNAFSEARTVSAATSASVTLPGPLNMTQFGQTVPSDYYNEHWIQIANGPGLGQARKISSYLVNADGTVTFTVTPAWSITPLAGTSIAIVSREFWQVYTVDNTVDNTVGTGLCTGNNQNHIKWVGQIGLAGMDADNAVDGNQQTKSGGIALAASYSIDAPSAGLYGLTQFHYFTDVRGNTIDGEVDYDSSSCSRGGIQLWFGAATAAAGNMPASPVVPGYAISIERNAVTRADGLWGGAITFAHSWHEPIGSKMYVNTLVHHNSISDLPVTGIAENQRPLCEAGTFYSCGDVLQGIGVNIEIQGNPVNYYTILYQNVVSTGIIPLVDNGICTVQVP